MDNTSTVWRRLLQRWQHLPLYGRILIALVLGVLTGVGFRMAASRGVSENRIRQILTGLATPAHLIIRVLGALATPLILFAVLQAVMQASLGKRDAFRVGRLLLLNTLVAICIGLLVSNVIRPGERSKINVPEGSKKQAENRNAHDPAEQLLDNIPDSLVKPLVDNNVIGIILIGIAFGIALRSQNHPRIQSVRDLVDLGFETIVRMLHWVIAFVPLGVYGIVASVIGREGFEPFKALGAFILTVLCGLLLQATWYLLRIQFQSRVSAGRVLGGTRDALLMAFSTDSSTATMPVTFDGLVNKVRINETAARLGALVGTNFNNDGTALYEAASALFVAQLSGLHLSIFQQLLVVLTSVLASVGAAGIPEAGLVTMTLVFNAVGLQTGYIPLLLTVDWFLDRSRTVINVMGDINVSCMLDAAETHAVSEARP